MAPSDDGAHPFVTDALAEMPEAESEDTVHLAHPPNPRAHPAAQGEKRDVRRDSLFRTAQIHQMSRYREIVSR